MADFIASQAKKNGLALTIKPCRAALPTITSCNRAFFDNWRGEKRQIEDLDRIKHNGVDDCCHTELMAAPLHLALELRLLKKIIGKIARELKTRRLERIVLASDHGATRLAVISSEEEPWQMPEKGRHGGRCCRRNEFDGPLPAFVTGDDEGKWHVLANYSRFRGGKPGAVEVHGGAHSLAGLRLLPLDATLGSRQKITLLRKFLTQGADPYMRQPCCLSTM